jgi:DNA replication and repair protein RecF
MPIIQQLNINHFRNLQDCSLTAHSHFNLIYGLNGSGKTSLLEAIYTVANGKSFRATQKQQLIQHNEEFFTVFTVIKAEDVHKIGLQKSNKGNARLQIDGQKCRSLSKASKLMPIIFLDPHSPELIELGPGHRRQYLDWALFHVEHDYAKQLQQYLKCVQQRNSALKQQQSDAVCRSWDKLLIELADIISLKRREILEKITPYFNTIIKSLCLPGAISMKYLPGWQLPNSFSEALDLAYNKDRILGYTTIGPQRADIKFNVGQYQAADVLSRGQEKLLVASVLLAQGEYYRVATEQQAIYLFDDISSELDASNQKKLISLFQSIPGQYFITSLSNDLSKQFCDIASTVFHVEHGAVETL